MSNWQPFYFLPLRYSILRLPSSECHELLSKWSIVLTSGLYSQPDFRSGIHLQMVCMNLINKKSSYLLLLALSVEFLSQPYWWPTTVPTNQVLLAELKYQSIEHNIFKNITIPVVNVVFSPILFVHRSVIVAVHHSVYTKNIGLVLFNNSFRF